jgi:putative lipase involved disintegration of autophagic bodies
MTVVPIHSLTQQIPFFLNHQKQLLERENTLTLKTIYHHASVNGPIPKLFRKLDISSDQPFIKMNQQQDASYTLKSQLSRMERPVDTQDTLYQLDNKQENEYIRFKEGFETNSLESTIGVVPDITHRPSIMSLAMMTYNAYLDININSTEWYDLGATWHLVRADKEYITAYTNISRIEYLLWLGVRWNKRTYICK